MSGKGKCPHANIVHCPLYVAGHDGGPSCIDDKIGEFCERTGLLGVCAVERGARDYNETIGKLAKVKPEVIAACARAENLEQPRAQSTRNMKAAGLH